MLGPEVKDRETTRDKAVGRLLALVRRRSAEDIDVVSDIAATVFGRWR